MTARRMGQRLLLIILVMIGFVAVDYLSMFVRDTVNPYVHPTLPERGYVTVVSDDGTQTWTKIGTLCDPGETESGSWNAEGTNYTYTCS